MGGPHVMQNRAMPRPMPMVGGMQRMQNPGIPAYNLASQAGMGGGVNPGGIPMQRGVAAQAHQQQQVCDVQSIILLSVYGCLPSFRKYSSLFFMIDEKERSWNGNDWVPSTAKI